MKTFSFSENIISEKWNIFRKCFYTHQTEPKSQNEKEIMSCKSLSYILVFDWEKGKATY